MKNFALFSQLAPSLFMVSSLLLSSSALGLHGTNAPTRSLDTEDLNRLADEDQRGNITLRIHPYVDKVGLTLAPASAAAMDDYEKSAPLSSEAFASWLNKLIAGYINNPYLRSAPRITQENPSVQGPGAYSQKFTFLFDEVKLCDLEVNAFRLSTGEVAVLGKVPQIDADETPVSKEQWPSLKSVQGVISSYEDGRYGDSYRLLGADRCYYVRYGKVLPSWKVTIEHNDLSYELVLDAAEVFSAENRFFDLASTKGTVQAYSSNPIDGTLLIFDANFSGDHKLTNTYFETNTSASGGNIARAESETHTFVYDPSDVRFDEASVFINANRMLEYLQTLGYTWVGDKPIVLRLHAVFNGNKNNALYEPTRNGLPSISIGDGDGSLLTNLPKDADVVSHEFVHHMVYAKVQSTSGQSLVLHEGLADFFAFSRTSDSCLGESICPADSPICIVPNKCLRTGSNSLTYLSETYQSYGAHQQGQIISGLLWSLRDRLSPDKAVKIAFKAVSFLPSDAGFADFFVGLLLADKELFQGADACPIMDEIKARNFGQLVEGIDCTNPDTWKKSSSSAVTGTTGSTNSPSKEGESRSSSPRCGTLAGFVSSGDDADMDGGVGRLLVLLLPLVVLLVLRRLPGMRV